MKTECVMPFQVENNDWVVTPDGPKYVYSIRDEGDFITLDLVDEEGDHEARRYGPFEPLNIVTSFNEAEEWEDVPIED